MALPVIDGYRDLEPIGKGGFSRVYKARQDSFGRDVAVKVIAAELTDSADRSSFQREAKLIGSVSTHPNIVTVHDTAYTAEGDPCLVMELYSGGTLADRVRRHGPTNARELLQVGVAIASALDVAHRAGILHRDIKPQNVFISDFGQPALGDFGISTLDLERTGKGSGLTLHYAAPEILEGHRSSVASDLYSLGATLYTIAAGRRPFDTPDGRKQTHQEVRHKILTQRPPSLTLYDQPEAVDQILQWVMNKDREHRPESAAGLVEVMLTLQERLGHARTSTVQGLQPAAAAQTPPPVVAAPSRSRLDTTDSPISPIRRVGGMAAAALAVVAVVGLLWFFAFGDDADPGTEPLNVAPTVAPELVPDVVVAPDTPGSVVIARQDDGTYAVLWERLDDPDDDSVVFEVRRTDVSDVDPVRVDNSPAVLQDVPADEEPCVVVLAIRGNRVATPTERVCAG